MYYFKATVNLFFKKTVSQTEYQSLLFSCLTFSCGIIRRTNKTRMKGTSSFLKTIIAHAVFLRNLIIIFDFQVNFATKVTFGNHDTVLFFQYFLPYFSVVTLNTSILIIAITHNLTTLLMRLMLAKLGMHTKKLLSGL